MKYTVDNDLHIHSYLSACARDPEQTNERILQYAQENGLTTICLTNHFWDELVPGASNWYAKQGYAHISQALPLPQTDGIRFLFGCETELGKNDVLGLSKERFDLFDFILIPTTHFHMKFALTPEELATPQLRADVWCRRFDAVLNMDLPFRKTGLAHLTCTLLAPTHDVYLQVLESLPEDKMTQLFERAAAVGVGIELNSYDMNFAPEEEELVLRPYRIAKRCGCKFFCGSDAHDVVDLDGPVGRMKNAVDLLGLTESDKFIIGA